MKDTKTKIKENKNLLYFSCVLIIVALGGIAYIYIEEGDLEMELLMYPLIFLVIGVFGLLSSISKNKTLKETLFNENNNKVFNAYDCTYELLTDKKLSDPEVLSNLEKHGIDYNTAENLLITVKENIKEEKQVKHKKAQNDILYGSLWLFGGILLSLLGIGYLFWGAIVFGAAQLIKGLINQNK